MKKTSIFEKQNEKSVLNILYAQRFYYNRSNFLESINVILVLGICIFDFFEIKKPLLKIIVNVFVVAINCIISNIISSDIKKGAKLKKYFDYKLFNFCGITNDFKKECKGYVFDVINKHNKNHDQQISNDGEANPPGLKNWYFDEGKIKNIDIIKSMQKQNLYWDKIISKIYLGIIICIILVLCILYFIVSYFMNFETLEILAGIIPFMSIIKYLYGKIKSYHIIDKNIECANILLNKAKDIDDLIEVQNRIDNRREENFAPPNLIHKIISKRVHRKIEFMN